MEYWIFPTNVKHYDIREHIRTRNSIIWKYLGNVQPNDIVFIYVGSPFKKILYRGVVTRIQIDQKTIEENYYAITENSTYKTKYLEIKLEKSYNEDIMPEFSVLKENGLGQVQKQARASRRFLSFIKEFDEDIFSIHHVKEME